MKELIIVSIFLLSISTAFAQTYDYCSDNSTLIKIREVTVNVPQTNRTRTINVTETVHCDYGCSSNVCRQSPWIMYGIIFGLIIVASIIYILITHR